MKITLRTLICVIILVLLTTLFTACGSDSGANKATNDEAPVQQNDVGGVIKTKVGDYTLKYPSKWEKDIMIAVEKETVKYSSGETPLFDIILGDSDAYLFGTLNDGTEVHLKNYEVKDNEKLIAMQEDANTLLNHLSKDYGLKAASSQNDAPQADECYAIETSVVTLYYPEKWKNDINVEEQDNVVSFSADGTPLFDILFDSDDGVLLGTYNDVAVSLKNYEPEGEKLLAMQEAANDIVQHLYEEEGFKPV